MDYKSIEKLIADDRLPQALSELDELIAAVPGDARLYFLRGKVNWRLDRRSAAITDYEHAVALDPDSEAAPALALARVIMYFLIPDLFYPYKSVRLTSPLCRIGRTCRVCMLSVGRYRLRYRRR